MPSDQSLTIKPLSGLIEARLRGPGARLITVVHGAANTEPGSAEIKKTVSADKRGSKRNPQRVRYQTGPSFCFMNKTSLMHLALFSSLNSHYRSELIIMRPDSFVLVQCWFVVSSVSFKKPVQQDVSLRSPQETECVCVRGGVSVKHRQQN